MAEARQLPDRLRRTKIIATLGPASEAEAVLRRLIAAGMDVARLNFSHGTRAEHGRTIRLLRRLAGEAGLPLAILQDLQGPKIRVGRLPSPVDLKDGATIALIPGRAGGRRGGSGRGGGAVQIPVPFAGLGAAVRRGSRILMKDGTIELVVTGRRGREILCRVVRGGVLGAHQGVNLPGVRIRARALTAKDIGDLTFGLRHGVDAVALSFVRTAADLRHARRVLARLGRDVPLIAKLEKAEAITNLDEIVAEADAVMVARGDLGVELPAERVPLLQKRIIRRANAHGIPVITATQMLESMVRAERPTRAETSDVANAVLDGTDAVMLSAETAAGKYPVQAVETMARIARAVEDGVPGSAQSRRVSRPSIPYAIGGAAQALTEDLDVALVVAITTTGRTARLLSQRRLAAPVLACLEDERVARSLAFWWGVTAFMVPFQPTTEAMIGFLDREICRRRLGLPGQSIVVVGSVPLIARGRTNFVQVHRLGTAGRRGARGPGRGKIQIGRSVPGGRKR